jgi:tetratricopeptide (TPR) repeat protein
MPLPGGPSDKIGNRYELRWVVRQLVDLVTGRLEWLRIEPPGDDAIEFRCGSHDGESAHQVKRGISGGGHWTLAALGDVLDGFGSLLAAEPKLQCVFISTHAAPELQELAERAQASRDLIEFKKRFLTAEWVTDAWSALRKQWRTDEDETWNRLRRLSIAAIGEQVLRDNTDTILQLLFDAPPETTRAVLSDLVLDSIHVELRADDIVTRLEAQSIRRVRTTKANTIAPGLSPPPAAGVRRDIELERISALLSSAHSTIIVGGISGIGKTTVAAQFAAEWNGAVCWLDTGLITSGVEALAAIGEYVSNAFADDSIVKVMPKAESQVVAIGRLAGKVLTAHECLLVWDGVDGERHTQLRPVIDAIATTLGSGGVQLVTTQETRESGKVATSATVRVDRLARETVAQILTHVYPNARAEDVEIADDVTRGHPYLVQLLVDAAGLIDLGVALQSMRAEARVDPMVSALMENLTEDARRILGTLTWLDLPFGALHVERLGGSATVLKELAARHLIVRSGGDAYQVHDLVGHLIKSAASERERIEFHERAALLLRGMEKPSWLEVRAMLRHARAASLTDVIRETGSLLLRFALDRGHWGLAREAAESLTASSTDFFPHFVLAKAYRMTREFAKALLHYEVAEENAPTSREREMARYDRASVLCELGRRPEADAIYTAMLDSSEASTRSAARLALALGAADRGHRDEAMQLLEEALEIATEANDKRQVAEAHHAIGRILIDEEKWEEARAHLKQAHTIRMTVTGPEAFDVLGWFHLFESVLRVERALGNRQDARNAAHGLWRFAAASGSIRWETNAAHALCLADPNDADPDVIMAMSRLYSTKAEADLDDSLRVAVLESLIICEWSLKHYEEATELILELLALGNEHHVGIPIFAFLDPKSELEENVVQVPRGYGLFAPFGQTPEFITAIVSRVLARRPELIQHANAVIGERPARKKPPNKSKRAATKKNKRRRGK